MLVLFRAGMNLAAGYSPHVFKPLPVCEDVLRPAEFGHFGYQDGSARAD